MKVINQVIESKNNVIREQLLVLINKEDEIKLLNEIINNLHKAMVNAEKRGYDKAMKKYQKTIHLK